MTLLLLTSAIWNTLPAQIATFPYTESFDGVVAPALPTGWTTSTNRLAGGDFVTSTSSPRSSPNTAFSQNATITQFLVSPVIDFSGRVPEGLQFYTARSATHTAGLLVEASVDGGASFPLALSDTLFNPGTTAYVLSSLILPSELANQPNVRIRWRIVGLAGSGTAGTLRLDDITLTIRTEFDLGITRLAFAPPAPSATDNVTLTATVRNFGTQAATGYSVRFYRDANSNSIAEEGEAFATETGPPLAAGDSVAILAHHGPLGSGTHRMMAVVTHPSDESRSNDTASVLISIERRISTFPYVENFDQAIPPLLPPGWATTTNRSAAGDFVTDPSSPRSAPNTVFSQNAQISQTLTSPTFDFSGRRPDRLSFYTSRSTTHTAGLLVEASLDNGISFPLALSDTIRNPGVTGYVLTTIALPHSLENQAAVNFRWRLVGTPGGGATGTFRFDDVSLTVLLPFDVGLARLQASPTTLSPRDNVTLSATVRNFGTQPATGYSVRFYRDANNNGIAEEGEAFATQPGAQLSPGDTTVVTAQHGPLSSGVHRMMAVAVFAADENRSNDTISVFISVGVEERTLVINEIMYEELAGQNEWVEFYHRGSSPVDLANWRFRDRPTAGGSINTFTITTQQRIVQPGDFVVVAADSTILSLFPHLRTPAPNRHLFILNRSAGFSFGNTGDDIVLMDFTGRTIDSVAYSPRWHHQDVTDTRGRSLERINPNIETNDPRNWSTSAAPSGGTPGLPNSIFTTAPPTSATLTFAPNPFSPDGDGHEDFCSIRFNLPLTTSMIRVRIFDVKGRHIRTLANAELAGPEGEIIWDGLDDARQRVRIGPYIVYLEAVDGQGGTVATAKGVVVVAGRF